MFAKHLCSLPQHIRIGLTFDLVLLKWPINRIYQLKDYLPITFEATRTKFSWAIYPPFKKRGINMKVILSIYYHCFVTPLNSSWTKSKNIIKSITLKIDLNYYFANPIFLPSFFCWSGILWCDAKFAVFRAKRCWVINCTRCGRPTYTTTYKPTNHYMLAISPSFSEGGHKIINNQLGSAHET